MARKSIGAAKTAETGLIARTTHDAAVQKLGDATAEIQGYSNVFSYLGALVCAIKQGGPRAHDLIALAHWLADDHANLADLAQEDLGAFLVAVRTDAVPA
jgi:hypothetical protein